MTFTRWLCASIVLLACEPTRVTPTPEASATAAATSVATVAAPAALASAPWFLGAWQGTYQVVPHRIERPSVQIAWIHDHGAKFTGPGTVGLESDGEGHVRGTSQGALGAQAIVGTFDTDTLTFRLQGRHDTAQAFSGVVRCPKGEPNDRLECTLSASSNDGNLVRSGTASLRRQASSPARKRILP